MRTRQSSVVFVAVTLLMAACGGDDGDSDVVGSDSDGGGAEGTPLEDLIVQANEEGALSVHVNDSAQPATDAIADAFLSHFEPMGLDIDVSVAATEEHNIWSTVESGVASGADSPFDVILGQASEETFPRIQQGGLIAEIDNWEELLAAVNPAVESGEVDPSAYSPGPLAGQGFYTNDRIKVILYNPNTISEAELPRTYEEWANEASSTYSEQYVVAPWSTVFVLGIAHYDREEYLEILGDIGANAAGVMHPSQGAQAILSGRIAFQQTNIDDYFIQSARGDDVPLEVAFFEDFTGVDSVYYSVPENAKNPAAGTLFALWQTRDDAREAWAPSNQITRIKAGQLPIDNEIRTLIDESGSTVIDFIEMDDGLEHLEWIASAEGVSYLDEMSNLLTQRE